MLDKKFLYVVVGASNNPAKYGHIVFKDLLEAKFQIIPVNLKEKEILGQKVYKRLSDIPEQIDIVVSIVPPQVSLEIAKQMVDLKLKKFWMQPGSESNEVIDFCKHNNIEYSVGKCIMVEKKRLLTDYIICNKVGLNKCLNK